MEALEWLNNNQLSYDIWNNKYRYNNETFEEWLERVSNHNTDIKRLIREKKFLFGGRTLANRNTINSGSYSNCYSIGYVPDSLEGIMDVANKIALTFKAQGGQGLSLSKIRPKGAKIGASFESDGIVPFMHIFNTVTESISQGGSRKGALMMSIDVWHKEAPTFITIKQDSKEINKANLSVEIDDKFMQVLEAYYTGKDNGIQHITKTFEGETIEYDVNVPEVFNLICESAWKSAEPGVLFTNRFRNYNIMEYDPNYVIETSNPCGEQPLCKNGACNLSSINLSEYVLNPYTSSAKIDYESLKEDMYYIVEAMDMVLEENSSRHALKEQQEMARKYRNIGIGIMGLADMFVKLGIKYGSPDSIGITKTLMKFLFRHAVLASANRAKYYGNFPGYSDVVWDSHIMRNAFTQEELKELKKEGHLRNCSLLSVAPTGSIGTMLNISTGTEPFFMLSYKRKTESLHKDHDVYYDVEVKAVEDYRKVTGNQGALPEYFITSKDINYLNRIAIQAALQDYTDTAISSTINLPKDTTLETVKKLYREAWRAGLKGVTIYVDGSRDPILSSKETKQEVKEVVISQETKLDSIEAKSRETFGKALNGKTYKFSTACGTLYITINKDKNGNIVEIFTNSSKNGTCKANLNGETRLASLALRSGVKVSEVIDSLKSIQCQSCAFARAKGNKIDGSSCPDIIAKCIKQEYESKKEYIQPITEVKNTIPRNIIANIVVEEDSIDRCPECGKPLAHIGGCVSCSCGFSKCG